MFQMTVLSYCEDCHAMLIVINGDLYEIFRLVQSVCVHEEFVDVCPIIHREFQWADNEWLICTVTRQCDWQVMDIMWYIAIIGSSAWSVIMTTSQSLIDMHCDATVWLASVGGIAIVYWYALWHNLVVGQWWKPNRFESLIVMHCDATLWLASDGNRV